MPGDYAVLAPIYNETGMATFAQVMTPRLIDFAQRHDWLGRRVLDLGCGTGTSIEHLSQYMYNLIGVDNTPEMLAIARQAVEAHGISAKWFQQDIRQLGNEIGSVDLVFALNVMNDLNSLRDLEAVFTGVQRVLESGKLFIFDIFTVQGLTENGLSGDHITYDNGSDLSVFTTNQYDYERQMHTQHHILFRRQNAAWERQEARIVLRGFPVQAVASLLQRSGFQIMHVLNLSLETFDPNTASAPRVIFVAGKV